MRILTINIRILIVILFTQYDGTAGKMDCMKIHAAIPVLARETNHIRWMKIKNNLLLNILEQGLLSIIKQQLDNILSKVIPQSPPMPKQENCKCGKAIMTPTLRIAGGRDAKVR